MHMPSLIDITGHVFGRLTVESRAENSAHGSAQWLCRCACGASKVARGCHLRSGLTRSCNCMRATHGHASGSADSPEFKAWSAMKSRCNNPTHADYTNYGGRGISVCSQWVSSFESFLRDVGKRPSTRHSIDRIDNDGNYNLDNCRWSTACEQSRNRRSTKWITHGVETRTQTEWSLTLSENPGIVSRRINTGWTEAQAVTTPPGEPRK